MHKRTHLLAALHAALPHLPLQTPRSTPVTVEQWHSAMGSSAVAQAMRQQGMPRALADADTIYNVEPQPHPYEVIGIDGSQLYPDRHRGFVDCCVLNIGYCHLTYGLQTSTARLESTPEMVLPNAALPVELQSLFGPQTVDLLREARELEACLRLAPQAKKHPVLMVLDGTLLFGHLEGAHALLKAHFLGCYLQHMLNLAAQQIMHASYLSAARTKDLVNLLNAAEQPTGEATHDVALLSHVLTPGQRTAVFMSRTRISEWYQSTIRPCFFYLHTGLEIARIELPYWLATDDNAVQIVAAICYDQAQKGIGYPVCLAHAHRQAEITAADSELFFQTLQHYVVNQRGQLLVSAKQQKKDRLAT